MKHKRKVTLITALIVGLLAACAGNENEEGSVTDRSQMNIDESEAIHAAGSKDVEVTLKNSNGEKVGKAVLSETPKGVRIQLNASDIPPGTHGFHIHEVGKCLAPNFKSAGGHFNPTDTAHGYDHENGSHAGDLPNVEADGNGDLEVQLTAQRVTLEKGKNHSLLDENGSALVLHEGSDDGKSQPSGAAGKRIVCGVIGK